MFQALKINRIIIGQAILVYCLFCLSCSSKVSKSFNKPYAVRFSFTSPEIVSENGEPISTSNIFFVLYDDQYTLYKLPYHKTYEINNIFIYDSIKYNLLVKIKNDTSWYYFPNETDTLFKKVNGDSVIKYRAFGGGIKHNLIDTAYDMYTSHISTHKINKEEMIAKYYFSKGFYDSAYLYFDKKFTNLDFSLSKHLDSAYQSTLFKVRLCIKIEKDKNVPVSFYENILELSLDSGFNYNDAQKKYNLIKK